MEFRTCCAKSWLLTHANQSACCTITRFSTTADVHSMHFEAQSRSLSVYVSTISVTLDSTLSNVPLLYPLSYQIANWCCDHWWQNFDDHNEWEKKLLCSSSQGSLTMHTPVVLSSWMQSCTRNTLLSQRLFISQLPIGDIWCTRCSDVPCIPAGNTSLLSGTRNNLAQHCTKWTHSQFKHQLHYIFELCCAIWMLVHNLIM